MLLIMASAVWAAVGFFLGYCHRIDYERKHGWKPRLAGELSKDDE